MTTLADLFLIFIFLSPTIGRVTAHYEGGATGIPIPSGLPPEGVVGLMGSAIVVVTLATKWSFVGFLKPPPLTPTLTPTLTLPLVLGLGAPRTTSFLYILSFSS